MPPTSAIQRKLSDLTRRNGTRKGSRAKTWKTTRDGQIIGDAKSKLGYLLETEIFRPLSEPERTWLAESTTMVSCERGRVCYTPDEPGEVIFILKRGRVDLYRIAADGRKLVVATLGPHTIFGEMGLLGQGMYGCYAEAAEDSLGPVCKITTRGGCRRW